VTIAGVALEASLLREFKRFKPQRRGANRLISRPGFSMTDNDAREQEASRAAVAEYDRIRGLRVEPDFRSDFDAAKVLEVLEADGSATASRAHRMKCGHL
jgi:hypothetical protein